MRRHLEHGMEAARYGPRQPRPRLIDPYADYLRQRIAAFPALSGRRLCREIAALGYAGGYTAVTDFLREVRPQAQAGFEHPLAGPAPAATPTRLRRLLGAALKYGSRASRMGELVQSDHMTVSRDGQTLKEFRAVCPPPGSWSPASSAAPPHATPPASSSTSCATCPFPSDPSRSTAAASSRPSSRTPARREKNPSTSCRPAALPATVQRLRRTTQRHRTRRVLEPRSRRPHRCRRQRPPRRVPPLLQQRPPPQNPRHGNPHAIRCQSGCLTTACLTCLESA